LLIELLEIGIGILMLLGVVTQLIIPAIMGRPSFPIFRKKRLEQQLVLASNDLEDARIEQNLQDIHNQADTVRKPKKEGEAHDPQA